MTKLVVFFHPFFSDGGVERTNLYQAKGLMERGYEVEFLTTLSTDHFRAELEESRIGLVELGGNRILGCAGKVLVHLIRRSLRNHHVYFISCQYYVNVVSMLIAVFLRPWRRNITFINAERNHISEFSFRNGIKNKIVMALVPRLYGFADVIVANSMETARDLGRFIGKKVDCVYNPTLNDRLDEMRREDITEAWFMRDSRPCVIGLGRLSSQKDFGTLIRAIGHVRNSLDVRLVILGEGDQRGELEYLIRDLNLEKHVYLPGFVSNPYKFLAASDLFVLSSKYEGLPNALIEAVYLGIPAVSTACKSGPDEILFGGRGGVLTPVGDAERMAQAIADALSNPEDALRRQAVAALGLHRFRYEKVIDDLEQVISA